MKKNDRVFSMENHRDPLAVIGAYCCVPGAFSPDEFWNNLSQGKVSISTIPNSRYPFDIYKSEENGVWGRSFSNIAGVVDFEEFNKRYRPSFIQELIAGGLDPKSITTETLLLFAAFIAFNAIKSAGYNPFQLPDAPFSVFTGMVRQNDRFATEHLRQYAPWLKETFDKTFPEISEQESTAVWNDFDSYLDDIEEKMSPVFSGDEKSVPHYVARYIQQLFKFKGQGLVFDNACSTSLASVYLAKQFFSTHPDGIALCGGFSLITKTNVNLFSCNGASSKLCSRPFDDEANGLIQGEGCSFMLIRPLSAAINAGNQILGIIRGIGVSCDGKGKGLWAPNIKGQHLAITKAWEDAGVDSSDSPDYIEAHATSTRLGDATELEALNTFLKEKQFDNPIPITSVKANIGHLLEAAGATSAIKVLQSLRHQVILPQTSFNAPTTKFDWNNSPLYVQREVKSWPAVKDKKRLAIVEAFGIGGLNASAVFEGSETAQQTNKETMHAPAAPKAVAIVGIGCVAPGAFDAKALRSKVKQGESAMSFLPEDRGDLFLTKTNLQELKSRGVKAGFINGYSYDWKRHNIPPKHLSLGHQLQYWCLGAIDQAVDDAGMPQNIKQSDAQPERWDRSKTAIIAGCVMSTDYADSMISGSLLCDIENSIHISFDRMGIDKAKTEDVTKRYHDAIMQKFRFDEDPAGGYSISTVGSRVAKCYDVTGPLFALDNGYSTSVTALTMAFNVLQDSKVDRVFCICGNRSQEKTLHNILHNKDASIAPPAEGAAAFVLKRADDALANGDKIYAIIPKIEMESTNACIQRDEEVKLTNITMRSCSSSETSDIEKPVTNVFGDFGSLNGMMALVNVLLDIKEKNQAAPSVWQIQHKDCEGVTFTMDMENTAAYRSKAEKRESEIKNSDKKELRIDSKVSHEDHSDNSPRISSGSALRHPGSRIAFLFEGQGAQYPNMMSGLTELPGAKEIIGEIDESLLSVGLPDFKTVLQTEGTLLGKDTFRTQLSLLIADTFIYRLYSSQGIRADVLMGHSYGEYPAMTAAGVWSFEDAALATQKRCMAIESALADFTVQRTRTAMLSTNASEDQIEDGMATIPDAAKTIYVSNRNAPTQTIISGTYDAIKKMEKHLLACQRLALILPVPAAFHSPLMSGVHKPFAEALKPFEFDLPTSLLLSSVTSAFESDPDVFRSNLVEQMTKPVDFIAMIRKAYSVGCRHFVDIGPKRILTNLAKQILSDCADVTFYISDNSKGGDPDKFLEVCNQLRNLQDIQATTQKLTVETHIEKEESRKERIEAGSMQSVPQSTLPASSYSISICRQSGTPYEMGLQYGKQYTQELRAMVRRYVDIVGQSSEKLLPPIPAMDKESLITRFGKDGYEELRGIADGAGIPLEILVRHNICLFPTIDTLEQRKITNAGKVTPANSIKMDSASTVNMNGQPVECVASGCVQFAGTTPNGAFIHGCNIDLPFKRIVPDSVQVQVQVRQPAHQISHCYVGVTGMVGAIGGINSKGLCVTSCTLLDYPTPFQVKPEAMEHPTLIEKILSECSNIEQALQVIYKNGAIGGWTIGLTEGGTGAVAQVEYCDKMVVHRDAIEFLAQANHSQLLVNERPERGIDVPEHSRIREARLRQILTNDGAEKTMAVDALTAFAALRDVSLPNLNEKPLPGAFRTINMVHRIDNVCSWMFNHTAQTLMVASTPDIYVSEDDKALWNEIPIKDLLPDYDSRLSSEQVIVDNVQSVASAAVQTNVADEKKAFSASEIVKFTPSQFFEKINHELPELEKTITGRYLECLIEAPALPANTSAISGRTIIFGSEKNPVVAELVRYLKSASNDYVVYELCVNGAGKSEQVIVEEIDSLWKQSPVCNIFVVPSWDDNSSRKFNRSDWNRTEYSVILPLYLALRQIYRCANADKAIGNLRLAAGVCLGGDFGFAGYSDRIEGGAIAALIRVLHNENAVAYSAKNNYKTIDFPLNTNPQIVANTLVKELLHDDWQPDISYQSDKRYFLSIYPDVIPSSAIEAADEPKSGEVWLVTGGARGVTAELAYYLAKKRKAKLYLLASSPLPNIDPTWRTLDADGLKKLKQNIVRVALAEKKNPASEWSRVEKAIEIDKNLHRMDEAKISWTYMACDLSSYDNAAQAVKQILRQEGHISGILHGAGFEKSAMFYKKEERFVRMTLDVKVGSLWAILETLEQNLPDYIIMMGSTAGRLGGNSQSDYGLSNYLCSKMLNRYSAIHPHCRAFTVHWNAWDEVGMSVRPESLFAFKSRGMAMMPVKEGCDHFYNELIIENYQPELSPVPLKSYQNYKLRELEQSGIKLEKEDKNEIDNELQDSKESQDSISDSDIVFGSNADAYELRYLLQKTPDVSQTTPVLMVCRDEQLSRLMTKAQIMHRQKTVEKSALDWVQRCKRNGAEKVLVPTSSPADPITLEFIESIKAILPVEQIEIPWTTEPSKCAQTILTVLKGGKVVIEKQEKKPTSTPSLKPALLSNIYSLTEDAIEAECTIDPVKDVFLQQHQLKGRPILPIVMGLELVAETANVLSVKQGLPPMSTITDVRIIRGMTCTQDSPYRLVCRLEKSDKANVWNALVKGDFYNKAGKKINENCPYYRCNVSFSSNVVKHELTPRQTSLNQSVAYTYPAWGERGIYHGPTLHCLKAVRFNDGSNVSYAIGDIIPQENSAVFGSRTGQIATYPAIMDACLYSCGFLNFLADRKKAILVPDQFESIEFGSGKVSPGDRCECCCHLIRTIELPGGYKQKIFNYTLYSSQGEVVVNVVNCQATVVQG